MNILRGLWEDKAFTRYNHEHTGNKIQKKNNRNRGSRGWKSDSKNSIANVFNRDQQIYR